MSGGLLSARGLSVTLRGPAGSPPARVLLGVDLSVEPGECVAVVGESGAGKSQLARALCGLSPAGAEVGGELRFRGQLLRPRDEAAWTRVRGAGIGLVHQDSDGALAPHRRLGSQLSDVLLAHGAASRAAARAEAVRWFERVAVPHPDLRLGQYPFELSGGLRQRAALALALAARPALLVADEPTSALDPPLALELLALLLDLRREAGIGLVLISHDLGVVAAAADWVHVLYRGVVVESGGVDALYAAPRHPYTASLLGRDLSAAPAPVVREAGGDRTGACVYRARCARASAACLSAPQVVAGAGPFVRCHHPLGGGS